MWPTTRSGRGHQPTIAGGLGEPHRPTPEYKKCSRMEGGGRGQVPNRMWVALGYGDLRLARADYYMKYYIRRRSLAPLGINRARQRTVRPFNSSQVQAREREFEFS